MVRALATVAAALVVVVLGVAVPPIGVVVAMAVTLAVVPLAPTLAARVGVAALLWCAASQFAYTVPWNASWPPRQAVAWTLVALGGLVATLHRPRPWREWLPRVGWAEAALAAFAVAVAWWVLPWVGGTDHVLTRLLLGWDHSGHFAMVEQLRTPSAAWGAAFPGYPQGFHALAASLMEVLVGVPGSFATEVVAYTQACLVVVAASLLMLAAPVLSSRAFVQRPLLLPPAVAALVTILIQLDDASQATYYGFVNFLEAAAFAGATMLLPLVWTRPHDRWRWFLFGAAAAGILGTWPVLLAFVVPVPVSVWLGRRRREPDAFLRLVGTAWPAIIPIGAALVAQRPTATGVTGPTEGAGGSLWNSVDRFLLLDGAIRTSSLAWPVIVPLVGLCAPLLINVLVGRPGRSRAIARWLWPAPAVAVSLATAMVLYEHVRVGEPRYYGLKVLCATTISAGCVGVAAVAHLLAASPRRVAGPTLGRRAASAAATIVLLCCAGPPVPVGSWVSPGGAVRANVASTEPDDRRPLARAIGAACATIDGRPGEYYLLLIGATREDLVRAGVWIIGCGENWGSDQAQVLRQLLPDRREDGGQQVIDLPEVTRAILAARPKARVLVSLAALPVAESHLSASERERLIDY